MRIDWTILGLTTWGPRAPAGADPQKVAEVIRYFDPACFAHRIHAPINLYVGLFDFTGPVQGILTAINALPPGTPCRMVIDPYGDACRVATPRSLDRLAPVSSAPQITKVGAAISLRRGVHLKFWIAAAQPI